MSLLAVLVGGFIVYNTMTFAVLRRRPLLGTLRTLGVTRAQLFRLVLSEALAFASIGALAGIGAGIAVGWGLVQLVTRTINDLYFALTVSALLVSPWSLLKGAGMGVLVTLIAALGPALEAAASQPRDVLRRHRIEQHGHRLLPRLPAGGMGLMLAALAVLAVPNRSIEMGFIALFMVAVGLGLCVPLMLRGFATLIAPLLGRLAGPQGRLAARGITASISRTGIAVAALTVAVSATLGVAIMIDSFRGFEAGELILISEPYAYHQELGAGDRVSLFTAGGWRELEVGGVFIDYGSDSGMLILPRRLYADLWNDPGVSPIGLVLKDGAALEAAVAQARAVAGDYDTAIQVRANRSIREQSLEVFDRTFAITRVLRLLAVGVACVGVLSALMAVQLERAREHAILRATGVTRGQLVTLILLQTSALGMAAGLFALPLGWIMGDILIQVINVRSFGWTMAMRVPGSALLVGLVLAWGAAAIAGLYPAVKVARTNPAAALRDE